MKYRTKQFIKRTIFTALFIFVLGRFLSHRVMTAVGRQRTCYAIITNGERAKYVHFITKLLQDQWVMANDIHIIHDGGNNKQDFMDKYHYHVISNPNKKMNTVYKKTFQTLFEKTPCEYVAIFEDDIFPGADTVSYFRWGRSVMEDDYNVLSVSGSHDNAEAKMVLNPQVFVKAEQLLGLGWLTSKRFHDKVFSRIDEGSKIPWDKQVNDMMNGMSFVSVFPHLPRTVHVPWTEGRNGHLVGLQLATNEKYRKEYVPVQIFNDYGGAYLDWLTVNFPTEKKEIRRLEQVNSKTIVDVAWPFSYLANRPFGYYAGIAIYPTTSSDGKIVIVYKSKT